MSQSFVLVDIQNCYFPCGAMELKNMDAVAAAARAGETVVRKHFPNRFRDTTQKSQLDTTGSRDLVIVSATVPAASVHASFMAALSSPCAQVVPADAWLAA